jgi:hypothetical protein
MRARPAAHAVPAPPIHSCDSRSYRRPIRRQVLSGGESHDLAGMFPLNLASLPHPFAAAKLTYAHFFRNVTIRIFPLQTGFWQSEVEW